MMELLIIGGFLFVAYTLAQSQRAQLASGLQPNTLISNTGGRSTVVTGEPLSASPLALTQQSKLIPSGAVIGPPLPPISNGGLQGWGTVPENNIYSGPGVGPLPPIMQGPLPPVIQKPLPPVFLGPPVTAIPAISGSTSFTTAADPATGMEGGIVRDLTI